MAVANSSQDEATQEYTLYFEKGRFFGPGQMPDAQMPKGVINPVIFEDFLSGVTPYFNNGSESPNLKSRDKFPSLEKAMLSDGSLLNENMDGGVVDIGMGAMSLLNVVAAKGPNKGQQQYQLDSGLNWNITTDLALDPGFPQGLLIINNLNITTSLIWVPTSLQTQQGIPGGADVAGSLTSGTPLVGELGDKNNDGYLDGRVVGQASIPLQHIFSPGAPAVQSRYFYSDIPIQPIDAALLTLAGVDNYRLIWQQLISFDKQHFLWSKWLEYLLEVEERINTASTLLANNKLGFDSDIDAIRQQLQMLKSLIPNDDLSALHSDKVATLTQEFFTATQGLSQLVRTQSKQLSKVQQTSMSKR